MVFYDTLLIAGIFFFFLFYLESKRRRPLPTPVTVPQLTTAMTPQLLTSAQPVPRFVQASKRTASLGEQAATDPCQI